MNKTLLFLTLFNLFSVQNCLAHSVDNDQSLINYSQVGPQVSFKAIMDLPVKQPDSKIVYGADPLQYGQLWLPQKEQNKALIVLVHGGCWLNAFGVNHSFPMATALSQAGHPVWSLEYRRTGDTGGGWPGSYEDIKLALIHLSKINENGVNTEQPILMGHSAGGHLALLAASEFPANKFKQVIGLAAITDVSRYSMGQNSCQQATPQFMGGVPYEQTVAYQEANLIYRKPTDNILLLHGDADQIVPEIQASLHQVPKVLTPEAGHFDWIHPGSPAFQKLLEVIKP